MSDDKKKDNEDLNSDWEFGESETSKKGMGEVLKKILTVGMGAAFMTEESIRNYVGELKLPKDVLNYLLQGAKKSKEELISRVGNEVIGIIKKIDFVEEASRFVETHKFKISAEVEVIKKKGD